MRLFPINNFFYYIMNSKKVQADFLETLKINVNAAFLKTRRNVLECVHQCIGVALGVEIAEGGA